MTERPILFSAPMVRAILDGRKTQTRRIAKSASTPIYGPNTGNRVGTHHGQPFVDHPDVGLCPHGAPGDHLWVREMWWHHKSDEIEQAGFYGGTVCNLDGVGSRFHNNVQFSPSMHPEIWRKRLSIHMPRWASRATLEITEVRVERLQEISAEGVAGEGVETAGGAMWGPRWWVDAPAKAIEDARASFSRLWESINGAGSWGLNPWAWAITFKVVTNA